MRLTDHTDYSLRVLMYMNQHKRQVTLNELADVLQISRNSLIKVSNRLTKNKFITSTRGKFGGLTIANNAGKLTIKEIVSKTEESMYIAECFSSSGNCVFQKKCALKKALKKALKAFLESLGDTNLDDITPKDESYKTQVI